MPFGQRARQRLAGNGLEESRGDHGDLVVIYWGFSGGFIWFNGDLMGFIGDFIWFIGDWMEFIGDLLVIEWDFSWEYHGI